MADASPICRGKNLTLETVLAFINAMPKCNMAKSEFMQYCETRLKGWTQTHSQIARQMALYYEDEQGICHPRFYSEVSVKDAVVYAVNWAKHYFVPNPYTPSLQGHIPTNIYAFFKGQIKEGNDSFDVMCNSIFGIELNNMDKVRVYLNNFTDLIIDDNNVSVNEALHQEKVYDINPDITISTAADYYNYFSVGLAQELADTDEAKSAQAYLSAIRTKPFLLLAGISGTGKSRIVRRLAQATTTEVLERKYNDSFAEGTFADDRNRWKIHKPANFELIQVKPNWHNSMDVVGYQTNIPSPHYVFTPFVEFIVKAWQNPDVPFFLCLDEMNLAPVEEYFAEFLSAIESRTKEEGVYRTDPIIKPFDSFNSDETGSFSKGMIETLLGKEAAGSDNTCESGEPYETRDIRLAAQLRKEGLTLPENLIVIGTVNMDETTFSFSRKVLDRAMSFEMNEVDYSKFLDGQADIIGSALSPEACKALIERVINASDVKEVVDSDFIISYLIDINLKLDNTPFKLGYRAANEAILYVAASKEFGQDDVRAALDEFTLMKILSRIEGDSTKLKSAEDGTILDQLKKTIENRLSDPAAAESKTKLKSIEKLDRMAAQLERNSFVSYWE